MRQTFGFALAAAVFALALGCGKKDSTNSGGGGTAGLEGNWKLVSIETGGQKVPAEKSGKKAEDLRVKATASKIIFTEGGKEEPNTYKLNTSKTPNEIDITEDGKNKTIYGIYKLEGKTLTLAVSLAEKAEDRPKDFKSDKDSPVVIMTLEKE